MLSWWRDGLGMGSFETRSTVLRSSIVLFVLLLILSVPLLTGNVHYLDDNIRTVTGDLSYWINNGRPLAVGLAWLISFSSIVSDPGPLFLIMGLAALAAMLCLSMGRLTETHTTLALWLSFTLMVSPFAVQSMLYAYDSLPMLLSVGLAVTGSVTVSKRWHIQCLFSFTLILAAICLYQTALNYSLIMLTLALVLGIEQGGAVGRDKVKLAMGSLSGLLAALIVYRALVVPYTVTDHWNISRSVLVSLDADGLARLGENAATMLQRIKIAFPGYASLPVLLIFAIGTCGCWKIGLRQPRVFAPRGFRYFAGGFMCFAPLLVACAVGGFLLILDTVEFDPRVLTAFSAAVVFNICVGRRAWPRLRLPLNMFLGTYLVFCSVFMVVAFRSVANQSAFDNSLAGSIRSDLSRLADKPIRMVSIIGSSPPAPATLPARRRYPLLQYILIPALKENHGFEYSIMTSQAMATYPLGLTTAALRAYIPKQVLSGNHIYRLYRYKEAAVLDFETPSYTFKGFSDMTPQDPDAL